MTERKMTCIICPRGCTLTVVIDDGGMPKSVSGEGCKRGENYAKSEITDPRRTVTSTVVCDGGGMVAVKTSSAIPKARMMDVMEIINRTVAPRDTRLGDVLVKDVLGFGADLVATSDKYI